MSAYCGNCGAEIGDGYGCDHCGWEQGFSTHDGDDSSDEQFCDHEWLDDGKWGAHCTLCGVSHPQNMDYPDDHDY